MKKSLILFICLFALVSANVFGATVKFDTAVRGNIGIVDSMGTTKDDIFGMGGGVRVYLDAVFVGDHTPVYGGAVGAVLGYGVIQQQLKTGTYVPSLTSTEAAAAGFEAQTVQAAVPLHFVDLGIMGRFYPVHNVSIGLGFIAKVIVSDGDYMMDSAYIPNNSTAFLTSSADALIQPLAGTDIIPEIVLEVTTTRFFGNFGLDFGIHGNMLISGSQTTQLLFGCGASFGFRYRFSPY